MVTEISNNVTSALAAGPSSSKSAKGKSGFFRKGIFPSKPTNGQGILKSAKPTSLGIAIQNEPTLYNIHSLE
jgi:hypothetical protein